MEPVCKRTIEQTEVPNQVGLFGVWCPLSIHYSTIFLDREAHHLITLCKFFVATLMLEDGIFPLLELPVATLDGRKERFKISIEPEDVSRVELRRLVGHVDGRVREKKTRFGAYYLLAKGWMRLTYKSSPHQFVSRAATIRTISWTACTTCHRIHARRIP